MLGSEKVVQNVVAFGIASNEYETILGDHRPQYVDINTVSLLKLNIDDIGFPTIRRLKSSNPKCVKKYTTKTHESFISHNI